MPFVLTIMPCVLIQQFLSMLDAPGNPESGAAAFGSSAPATGGAVQAAGGSGSFGAAPSSSSSSPGLGAASSSSPGLEDAEGILNDICREYYAEGADAAARGLLFRMVCGLLRLMLPASADSSRAELHALLSRLRLVASSRTLRQLERECCRALFSTVPALPSAPARTTAPLPASVAHDGGVAFGQPAHQLLHTPAPARASARVSPDHPPSAHILKKYSL